jgi:hypothetical protein
MLVIPPEEWTGHEDNSYASHERNESPCCGKGTKLVDLTQDHWEVFALSVPKVGKG